MSVLGAAAAASTLVVLAKDTSQAIKRIASRYHKGTFEAMEGYQRSLTDLAHISDGIAISRDAKSKGQDTNSLQVADKAVERMLNGLSEQVRSLLKIVKDTAPGPTASRMKRARAAASSASRTTEDRIARRMEGIESSKNTLLLGLGEANVMALARQGSATQMSLARIESMLADLNLEDRNKPSARREGHFLIPFARNSKFIGREDTLQTLQSKIEEAKVSEVAVAALGGGGKTSVVVELLHRLRVADRDKDILWLSAVSAATFDQSCRNVAARCGLDAAGKTSMELRVMIKHSLESIQDRRWVLVIDNVDDADLHEEDASEEAKTSSTLLQYMPSGPTGTVLITSRCKKVAAGLVGTESIMLPEMSLEDCTAIFEQHVGRLTTEDRRPVEDLMKALELLPLAVVQAASYISMNSINATEYLDLYAKSDDSIITFLDEDFHDPTRPSTAANAVAKTLLISITKIEKDDELAAEYLHYLCCLAEGGVPAALLAQPSSAKARTDALGTLKAYSFVTIGNDTINMHRLVRLVMRKCLVSRSTMAESMLRAVERLSKVKTSTAHHGQISAHFAHVLDAKELPAPRNTTDVEHLLRLLDRGTRIDFNANDSEKTSWRRWSRRALDLAESWYSANSEEALKCMWTYVGLLMREPFMPTASTRQVAQHRKEVNDTYLEMIKRSKQIFGDSDKFTLAFKLDLLSFKSKENLTASSDPDEVEMEMRSGIQQLKEAIGITGATTHAKSFEGLRQPTNSSLRSGYRCLAALVGRRNGRIDDVVEILQEGISLQQQLLGDTLSDNLEVLTELERDLAFALVDAGKFDQAVLHMKHYLETMQNAYGGDRWWCYNAQLYFACKLLGRKSPILASGILDETLGYIGVFAGQRDHSSCHIAKTCHCVRIFHYRCLGLTIKGDIEYQSGKISQAAVFFDQARQSYCDTDLAVNHRDLAIIAILVDGLLKTDGDLGELEEMIPILGTRGGENASVMQKRGCMDFLDGMLCEVEEILPVLAALGIDPPYNEKHDSEGKHQETSPRQYEAVKDMIDDGTSGSFIDLVLNTST
ncbi:MAG: Golgi transport complex subunit 3 [Chrysothrix sp. TS-e1954]|nr:MAG: Golgi transport complex subunit 3 [Chrysothrix sp. TS-e1954]